jgi:nitrogen fixation/metabolism regulation signal transduction histidine kinase
MAKFERKPLAHFFVKKSLQIRLIIRIVGTVFLTTVVSLGIMALVYFLKYKTVVMYQLDQVTQNLTHQNILSLLLPSLLFSAFVNFVLAVGIGFYASRKYAIPIYKLEQWCSFLLKGNMTARLRFREKEELRELSSKCNEVSHTFNHRFLEIKRLCQELRQAHPHSETAQRLEKSLEGLDLHATETIEVTADGHEKAAKKNHVKQ